MTLHWLNPGFLWALPLALLPLLLLWRRPPAEPPVVPFAATQLLEKVAVQVARQQRRQQWWQTALRILVLVLVVLAFARPEFGPGLRVIADPSGTEELLPVGVDADPATYVAAALGCPVGGPLATGRNLVFLDEAPGPIGTPRTGETRIAAGPYYHPALILFDSSRVDLRDVRVRRWIRITPTDQTVVIARLANGDPFLLETLHEGLPTLVCTVAPDPAWSDLPLHPQFVPFVRELVRYLEHGEGDAPGARRLPGRDLSRGLLFASLLLAVGELLLGKFRAWRLVPPVALALVLVHPAFSWQRARPQKTLPLVAVDRTQSMRPRDVALNELLPRLSAGERVDFTGLSTDLAAPLRQAPARPLILLSDGQHNEDHAAPLWVAARRPAPVFTVAVGDPAPPRDLCLTAWRISSNVFGDEPAEIEATLTATGYDASNFPAQVVLEAQGVILQTNVGVGRVHVLFPVPRTGLYRLEVLPQAGETTSVNNSCGRTIVRIPGRIRVWLEHDGPTWEYRHARQALAGDPGLRLVDDPAQAEVTLSATGELWRLRRFGDEAFVRLWRSQARRKAEKLHHLPRQDGTVVVKVPGEANALGRNDDLLREIARVSGGEFFTAETIDQLPAALEKAATELRRFDLRNSLIVLLALLAAFTVCWGLGRPSSEIDLAP